MTWYFQTAMEDRDLIDQITRTEPQSHQRELRKLRNYSFHFGWLKYYPRFISQMPLKRLLLSVRENKIDLDWSSFLLKRLIKMEIVYLWKGLSYYWMLLPSTKMFYIAFVFFRPSNVLVNLWKDVTPNLKPFLWNLKSHWK